ncbi:AAA family ATPase [Corynebacterium amycolatum]|uniref:AAA family ATPase n=2 Tax=Corynebacterium amycolatum TaxID=43765 RepID=A0AAW9SPQ7_CORAY|nr:MULTISPECIES: AAA family ATPase [Corynebacterium]MDK7237074.1 AAA family ATPase [Corynebacterium amycolatum]MDK7247038.1 AAA family ATPase [Corynebacterium amycolatum]OHR25250.1 hypothetical protein HMPREF2985_01915 [Corynebacterium sp. HMSC072B09]
MRLGDMQEVSHKDFWIIEGALAKQGTTYVYGMSKMGKSFFVSQVINAALQGTDLLNLRTYEKVDSVLILTTDAGSDLEYKMRLDALGTDPERVYIRKLDTATSEVPWEDIAGDANTIGFGLVVVDHATALVEGEINYREGWVRLYEHLARFNAPTVLVGHSTDSRQEGKQIKRPAGNAAATQFARARVFLNAPGGLVQSPKRVLEFQANNAEVEPIHCVKDKHGFLVVDSEVPKESTKKRQRSEQAKDLNALVRDLATKAPRGLNKSEAARRVTEQLLSVHGIERKADSIRNILNRSESLAWNEETGSWEAV